MGNGCGHTRLGLVWTMALLGASLSWVCAADAIKRSGPDDTDGPWLCHLEIELAPDALASLREHSRQYVRARVRAEEASFHDVGVHLKGKGTFQPVDEKPSLTLDFGRFAPEQRFRGMRKIHLNNSLEDPSFVREWIGSALFRAAHVPAPRVGHALVKLNGRPLGLYVLKESFGGEFFYRTFGKADGTLYDIDEGHDVDLPMTRRQTGRAPDSGELAQARLAAAIDESDLARRWTGLQEVLDIPEFLSFMAMEVMICHWDGYCLARNNFRMYHPLGGRMVFLPAGMDQLFSNPRLTWRPHMSGKVAKAIMETPAGREAYVATFRRLFASEFSSIQISNDIQRVLVSLRPELNGRTFTPLQESALEVCSRISQREQFLKAEMAKPELAVLDVPATGLPLAEADWTAVDRPAHGKMEENLTADRKAALHIVAAPGASASWRTTLRLRRGQYRFEALARVRDFVPLPFGKNQGATVRVAGMVQGGRRLVGPSSDWTRLEAEFAVQAPEEDVELMCELRANGGEAWFAKDSLVVTLVK